MKQIFENFFIVKRRQKIEAESMFSRLKNELQQLYKRFCIESKRKDQ